MKKQKLLILPMLIFGLILEVLPYGAVLNFATPDGEGIRKTYSYFSLTPFGYANFAPFITAVFTCVLILLAVIFLFNENRIVYIGQIIITALCVICSLLPIFSGFNYCSLTGIFITLVLILQLIVLVALKNKINIKDKT